LFVERDRWEDLTGLLSIDGCRGKITAVSKQKDGGEASEMKEKERDIKKRSKRREGGKSDCDEKKERA
jgi:hypothetical protein